MCGGKILHCEIKQPNEALSHLTEVLKSSIFFSFISCNCQFNTFFSATQAGPRRRLSVPGGFGSPAGGGGARRGGARPAGGRRRSGAPEGRGPLPRGDERPVAGRAEPGLHAGLRAPREPPAGRGDPAEPDPALPGDSAHAGAGQRGER